MVAREVGANKNRAGNGIKGTGSGKFDPPHSPKKGYPGVIIKQ